jgi:hypothetical protein
MARPLPALFSVLFLAACAAPPVCVDGEGHAMRVYELYFGRSVPGRGPVTDAEWSEFQNRVVSANLPEGYTVLDAAGAWMNPRTKQTVSESTKLLIAATPDGPDSLAAIQHVRAAYKSLFDQQSVGMTSHLACASFDQ